MRERKLRRGYVPLAALLVVLLIGVTGCDAGNGSQLEGGTAELVIPPDEPSAAEPVEEAKRLARRGKYAEAIALFETAGLDAEADRVRRSGARALARSARRALDRGRHTTAKRLAARSRRLHRTSAARTIISSANAQIAKAAAAKRERTRLARIARDQRTCSSAEKRTVRDGGGSPPGCAGYAAEQAAPEPADECDPNYEGACLKPDSPDYDCAGGSGDGPDYTGPVRVVGDDPHDLDRDGDGSACETS